MCSCQRTFPEFDVRGLAAPSDFLPGKLFVKVVGVTGVEPVTLRLSSACSNQLSYTPSWLALAALNPPPCRFNPGRRLVELRRFELLTYSLQSYRSTN